VTGTTLDTARPVKRSVSIAGHRTSLSIEPIFWDQLKAFARHDNRSLAALIGELDAKRTEMARTEGQGNPANLSCILRVYVVQRLLAREV
jgi:predicted DNA-binding ribbon-helix-helix protein